MRSYYLPFLYMKPRVDENVPIKGLVVANNIIFNLYCTFVNETHILNMITCF